MCATDTLLELQDTLSKPDFETIEAFIILYNQFKPEEAGQARIGFEYFLQNLEKRYKRNFRDCHKVLSINLDDVEQELIENESKPNTTIARIGEAQK
ncbi:unnamed protein product [Agarophyton chilense]